MARIQLSNRFVILFAVILLFLAMLACGSSTTEQLSEAAQPAAESANATETGERTVTVDGDLDVEPAETEETVVIADEVVGTAEEGVPEPTEEVATEPTAEPTEEPMPEPTATPVPQVEPAEVVASGFGQEDSSVGYAFIVHNPNEGFGLEDLGYQVTAFDANGAILDTDSHSIPALFPGAEVGIGGDMYVEDGTLVDRIEVQLSGADAVPSESIPNFEAANIQIIEGSFTNYVSGLITSPFSRQFDDIRVSAVTYDADGNINGGGYTYVNFVPANGSTGVEVSVNISGEATQAEIFPSVSVLSLFQDETLIPDDGVSVEITNQGFGEGEFGYGVGMILENPNANYAIEDSRYRFTAYGADDTVLGTTEGYIEVILPGQTLGIGDDIYIASDLPVARVEALYAPGDYVAATDIPAFTTSDAAFAPGSFSADVNGQVNNPYSEEVTDLRVSALAFDEAGQIIGGGYTYLDFVPANATANVSVPIQTSGTPAMVELYAILTSLSDIGDN